MEGPVPSSSRRRVLAAAGTTGVSALAGCLDQLWFRAEDTSPDPVSLTIKTVPADDDVLAATIISQLRENLRDAGVEITHDPIAKAELYREIFLRRDFDLFVIHHPGFDDPDALRGLLHSDFVGEQGWQNPFSFADVTVDELLDDQQQKDGNRREETLSELYEYLAETTPFTTVVYPSAIGAIRSDIDRSDSVYQPIDYVHLATNKQSSEQSDSPLTAGVFGDEVTNRLNPLAVDVENARPIIGLLYDPLVRNVNGEYVPWLAEDVSWQRTGEVVTADVTLREGLYWHDGESLDVDDVTFTIEFLGDTSDGKIESKVPAPRFRNRQSVISSVSVSDHRTIRFVFGTGVRSIAEHALTIPLLPRHVWEPRAEPIDDHWTIALQTDNEEPIGSGIFQLDEVTDRTSISLSVFEEHPLATDETAQPELPHGSTPVNGIEFRIVRNPGAGIDALADGELDVIGTGLSPNDVELVNDEPDVSLLRSETGSFYMIGYNLRHPALGNPRFRSIVSRLVDREFAVEEYFDGFATAPDSIGSLVGIRDDKSGDDETEPTILDFPGSDGEIDVERVKALFEDAGYRYTNGSLLE